MASGAELLVEVLASSGVDYVFGMPGGGTVAIYTAMHGLQRPRPLLTRQEHGATVMADAYARASGRLAAAMGEGAFITANGAFGVMEARTSSSPLILIGDLSDVGKSPMPVPQSMNGDWGNPDAVAMMRAMTKYTAVASTPKEAVSGLQMAVKHAVSGCPGPTALLLRSEAIEALTDGDLGPPIYSASKDPRRSAPVPTEAHIAEAIDMIAAARRPVILAGKGVHNALAHTKLLEFAECWGVPVGTTYKGRGAVDERHPLALGMVGTFGRPVANQVVQDADVVVAIGTKLRSMDTVDWTVVHSGQRLIQVDVETLNANWALPAEVTLLGDARAVLEQLLAESARRAVSQESVESRRLLLREALVSDPLARDPHPTQDSSPVLPARLCRLLEEHLDPETNITFDAGNNRLWMGLFYRTPRPHSMFAPGGQLGMGWAIPAALGVKLARPGEPSLAVVGDGGFMMSVHALATAVDIPIVTVVMNDSSLNMIRQYQADRVTASLFPEMDHAAIARGFGLNGYRVTDSRDLPAAIKEAQSHEKSAVIDVVIDPEPTPIRYMAFPKAPGGGN